MPPPGADDGDIMLGPHLRIGDLAGVDLAHLALGFRSKCIKRDSRTRWARVVERGDDRPELHRSGLLRTSKRVRCFAPLDVEYQHQHQHYSRNYMSGPHGGLGQADQTL